MADAKTIAKTWADQRQRYPGWLIAPHHIREVIWSDTRVKLPTLLQSLKTLTLQEQIDVLDQVLWRQETCLLPLWDDIAHEVRELLGAVNDGGDICSHPGWKSAHPALCRLALATMQYHREECNWTLHSRFLDALQPIAAEFADLKARLCYEMCLRGLSRQDESGVREALSEWPSQTSDHIWQVRRASVLGELGEIGEATRTATDALERLRDGLHSDDQDIRSLSREAWTMLLVRSLKASQVMSREELPDYSGRWQQLSTLGCDPRAEVEWFEAALRASIPAPGPEVFHKKRFHPNQYTMTVKFGTDWRAKLLPAFQVARLAEEAPYPPLIGTVRVGAELLSLASQWLMRSEAHRSLSLVNRLLSEQDIERYLSRTRVATLKQEQIDDLLEHSLKAAATALGACTSSRRVIDVPHVAARAFTRVTAAIEVLTRVAIRANEAAVDQLWRFAIDLYQSPVVRNDLSLPGHVADLLRSLVLALPRAGRESYLIQLLGLPIPGSEAFRVAITDAWPEVTIDAAKIIEDVGLAIGNARPDAVAVVVSTLLRDAVSEDSDVRAIALIRLSTLFYAKLLTEPEIGQLAQAYWARTDNFGVPIAPGLYRLAALKLPELEPGTSVRVIRDYILGTELPGLVPGQVSDSGWLVDVLGATKGTPHSASGRHIAWSAADMSRILGTIEKSWEAFSKSGRSQLAELFLGNALNVRAERTLDVLRRVVVPFATKDAEIATRVLHLVASLRANALPVHSALPALRLIKPDLPVENELLDGMASNDGATATSAVRAIEFWAANQDEHLKLGALPDSLLHAVCSVVCWRRDPVLSPALSAIDAMIRSKCRFSELSRAMLLVGLKYLHEELDYSHALAMASSEGNDDTPDLRVKAATVAVRMKGLGMVDPILERWERDVLHDPLPEVRQVLRDLV